MCFPVILLAVVNNLFPQSHFASHITQACFLLSVGTRATILPDLTPVMSLALVCIKARSFRIVEQLSDDQSSFFELFFYLVVELDV